VPPEQQKGFAGYPHSLFHRRFDPRILGIRIGCQKEATSLPQHEMKVGFNQNTCNEFPWLTGIVSPLR
jgi:hypothetical protein